MADYYYGLNRGDKMTPEALTVSTTPTGKDVELHISTTNNPTKLFALLAIEVFEQFIGGNGVGTGTGTGVDLPPS